MLTKRQNLLETLRGGNPDRFVNQYVAFAIQMANPISMRSPMPQYGEHNVVDAWGVSRSYPIGTPGAFPDQDEAHILLKDPTKWREVLKAAQVVFDSGIPLLQIPCCGMCDHLTTTVPELEYYLRGKNALCDYLVDIVKSYPPAGREYAWSKVLWDVSAVAAIVIPNSLDTVIRATPILTDNCLYAYDDARHPMIYARNLGRDAIFECLFKHLTK
jgi:hypothetical protein